MNILSHKKTITLFGALLLFLSSFGTCFALKISPARIEIKGDPGQTITGEYLLVNELSEAKTFYSSFENFEAQGDTGAPHFYVSEEGLMNWIDSSSVITLQPNTQRKLSYSITIPEDADPGGHFAAIFWGTTNPNDTGDEQVMIGAKLGVLILLTVSGDVTEGGGVEDFGTASEGRVYTELPIEFSYKFKNTGGDKIKPEGIVKIKNILGITRSALNANMTDGYTLPGSTRKYLTTWGEEVSAEERGFFEAVAYQAKNFALGVYVAKLDVHYGSEGGLESQDSFLFFVLPWELLIVIFVVCVVLWRGIKGYNAMIIKKAQKMNEGANNS